MTTDAFDDPQLRFLLHSKLMMQVSVYPEPGQRWEDACWLWQGKLSRKPEDPEQFEGHGYMQFRGKNYGTHRLAYELATGVKVDPALVVRHKCDRSRCCNPSHLETGTPLDNVADRVARRRCATGIRNGTYTKPESRPRGETHRGAMITEEMAAKIKGSLQVLGDGYGVGSSIARHFSVNLSIVRGIRQGDSWADVVPVIPDPVPPLLKRSKSAKTRFEEQKYTLDDAKVIAMRKRYHEDQLNKHIVRELSEEFGVSKITTIKVLQLHTWAHVETPYDPMPKGGHGMTVLSAFMVQTIRATAGAHPSYPGINSRLAEKFNTTKTTIGRILSREQQPHVADDPSKALTLAELGMIC